MLGIGRREFVTLLGGAAAAWPLSARAQNGKTPVRLGFLPLGSPTNAYDRSLVEAFQQGLRRVGLIENRDVMLDVAWVSGDPGQAVSEVLQRGAELLIPCGSSCIGSGQASNVYYSHCVPQRRRPRGHGARRKPATSRTQRHRL